MEILQTNCPECGSSLEFPTEFDNVICANCGSAYHVRQYKGSVNLSLIEPKTGQPSRPKTESNGRGAVESIELKLAELDEYIEGAEAEIEAIKSREKAAPLQAGCAFFGLFGFVLLVFALYMTLGREYFATWPFYLSLLAVLALGLIRMRRKLVSPDSLNDLRREREGLEEVLAELRRERAQVVALKTRLSSKEPEASTEQDFD